MHQSQPTADCYNALPNLYVNLVYVLEAPSGPSWELRTDYQDTVSSHKARMISMVLQAISASPAAGKRSDS